MNPSEYREIVRDYLTNHNKHNIPEIYWEETSTINIKENGRQGQSL
jgi:nitrate reductase alpha subunit